MFTYLADSAAWDNKMRCDLFAMRMKGTAHYWFKQLPDSIQKNYDKLRTAFLAEYCRHTASLASRYYQARRQDGEDPVDYLNRLNSFAKQARIAYKSGDDGIEHVRHFLATVRNRKIADKFGGQYLDDISRVENALKEIRLTENRVMSAESDRRQHGQQFDQSRQRGHQGHQRPNNVPPPAPRITYAEGQSYWAVDDQQGYPDEGSYFEDYDYDEEPHAASAQEVSSPAAQPPTEEHPPPRPQAQGGYYGGQSGYHGGGRGFGRGPSGYQQGGGRGYGRGQGQYFDRSTLQCTACGNRGHTAERCWAKCKVCGKVHEEGACEKNSQLKALAAWAAGQKDDAVPEHVKAILKSLN